MIYNFKNYRDKKIVEKLPEMKEFRQMVNFQISSVHLLYANSHKQEHRNFIFIKKCLKH